MLTAVEYLGKVGVGITGPEFFRADDGEVYVVKRSNNYIGQQVLVSEILAAKFGQKLNLPFPAGDIIQLNYFMSSKQTFSPFGFASAYIHSAQYATVENIRQTKNFKEIAGIILFDHFFHNADRTNNRKNLLVAEKENQLFLYGIDHSHLFKTGRWNEESLSGIAEQTNIYANNLYGNLLNAYLTQDDFLQYIDMIKNLSSEDIDAFLTIIPTAWLAQASVKKALSNFISARCRLIDKIAEVIFNFRYRKAVHG